MSVALFTFHAYGSWLADRPQGHVIRQRGIQPENKPLAAIQRASMSQSPTLFDAKLQRLIAERYLTICHEEGYRPHAAATETTHVHLLTSWLDHELPIRAAGGRIKNLLSLHLSRSYDQVGHKWFSGGASRQPVKNRRHFDYLMKVYLPQHRGVFWSETTGWRAERG